MNHTFVNTIVKPHAGSDQNHLNKINLSRKMVFLILHTGTSMFQMVQSTIAWTFLTLKTVQFHYNTEKPVFLGPLLPLVFLSDCISKDSVFRIPVLQLLYSFHLHHHVHVCLMQRGASYTHYTHWSNTAKGKSFSKLMLKQYFDVICRFSNFRGLPYPTSIPDGCCYSVNEKNRKYAKSLPWMRICI